MKSISKDNLTVCLDVRPILANGNDPFNEIMAVVQKLEKGQTLQIINTFQPIPLINKLENNGYKSWTEQPEIGVYHTFFKKEEVLTSNFENKNVEESLKFEACYKSFIGKLKSIDVRHLEMPEPMTTILEELEHLPESFALFVDHKKVPQFLLPELEERGFEILFHKKSLTHIQLLIFKK